MHLWLIYSDLVWHAYGQNQLILSLALISSSLWFSMMLPGVNRDKENGARRMLFSQGIFTGMSSWPQSTTRIGTQSICTSMKSFHAIKEEIKSESLLATFFFLPWLHHKREQEQWRHWVVASSRLRCTAETHSIIKRACRLWSDLLKMTHIVNIAFPAASR